jgi:Arc/MetJ family transcription regulator
MMLICIDKDAGITGMRTTITIDDELFRKAVEVADPGMDKADIVREAMRVFVRIQSGKRLAALGGAAPRIKDIPRRRAMGRRGR